MAKTLFCLQCISFTVLAFFISSRAVKAFDYDLQGKGISTTVIELTWKKPPPEAYPNAGPMIGYRLEVTSGSLNVAYSVNSANKTADVIRTTVVPITTTFGVIRTTVIVGDMLRTMPSEPRYLEAYDTRSTSVCLRWSRPRNPNGQVGYIVTWTHGSVAKSQKTVPNADGVSNTWLCIDGLAPATEYTVHVAAETSAGMGRYSNGISVLTEVSVPSAPRNLTASIAGLDAITISWQEPQTYNPAIDGYSLRYVTESSGRRFLTVDGNVTQYTFGDLNIKTRYFFQVWAFTQSNIGESKIQGEGAQPINFTLEMTNFNLQADPRIVNLMTTSSFELNCSYEPEPIAGVDYKFMSLTLSKESQELVSIKTDNSVVQILDKSPSPHVEYSGETPKEDRKAFFVSGKWSGVFEDPNGYYVCTLELMDEKGNTTTNLEDGVQVVSAFKVNDVKREFIRLNGEVEKLKDQINTGDTGNSSKNDVREMVKFYLKEEMTKLKNQKAINQDLSAQLSALAEVTLQFDQSKDYKKRNYIAVNHKIKDVKFADAICQLKGGYLVEVNNREEWTFIRSFLATIKVDRAFIAGRRNVTTDEWYWPRNEQKLSFVSWYSQKPNAAGENCIETVSLFDWQWNDIECHNDFDVFICEIPKE